MKTADTSDVQQLRERLDRVERRLRDLSVREQEGLTDPDRDTGERWEQGQVWGHLAEFPRYWLEQARAVLTADSSAPAKFGRTVKDSGRLGGIERGRSESRSALALEAMNGIEDVRAFLAKVDSSQLSRVGLHPTRGELDVGAIVRRFIVDHLEEHAEQLERLDAPASGETARG